MNAIRSNKIFFGIVGGGPNSWIGHVNRISARFDNRFEFLAGVFSRDKKKSVKFGESLGIDKERCYNDFKEMAEKEAKRDDGIEALGIMTPSGNHYQIAKEFISNTKPI